MKNFYYDEPEHQYNYDPIGDLTQILENSTLSHQYNFNPANLLTSATTPKGKAEYTYNGFGNRVKRLETPVKDPMQEINYILDLTLPYDNLLMTKGSQNQSFIWGNELISASGDESYNYLQDHLGSSIRLAGDSNNPLAYDVFGAQVLEGICLYSLLLLILFLERLSQLQYPIYYWDF